MEFKTAIKVEKEKLNHLNSLLSMENIDFHALKIEEDATLETFTANFGNGIEVDIKVCSGQTNCFVDPILFDHGSEAVTNDTEDQLDGIYLFEYESNTYVVVVQ